MDDAERVRGSPDVRAGRAHVVDDAVERGAPGHAHGAHVL